LIVTAPADVTEHAGLSVENDTGRLEVAVAVTVYVPPTRAELGGVDVKVIV
jgi:hypothetical protein